MLCRVELTLNISHSAVMPSMLPSTQMSLPARLCSKDARPSWGPNGVNGSYVQVAAHSTLLRVVLIFSISAKTLAASAENWLPETLQASKCKHAD